MRKFLKLIGVLLLITAGSTIAAAWRFQRWLYTPVQAKAPVIVVIPAGASFAQIAQRLHAAGVIDRPMVLRAYARTSGSDRGVRSGEFLFDRPLTPPAVLEKLHGTESFARRVTIPEGHSARQIREALERAGLGGRDVYECVMQSPELLAEFDLPATGIEGYLFPDTYEFDPGVSPEAVVRRMLTRFREVSAGLAEQRRRAGMSEEEMVTLASVIEKETGAASERPLVAGVFHNRMRLGMKLQSDPTIIYGRDGDWTRPITRSDLVDPHPYNTYAHTGLPPGPIANPGRAALAAAVEPDPTTALYFVSRNDGTHVFSSNLADHNAAVRKYQR